MKRIVESPIRYQIVVLIACILIPLLSLSIYATSYTINILRQQVATSNQALLQVWINQINTSFDEANKFYYSLAVNDPSFELLMHSGQEHAKILAKYNIWSEYKKRVYDYNYIDALFLIEGDQVDILLHQQADSSIAASDFEINLHTVVDELSPGWSLIPFDDDLYIIELYQFMNVKVGYAASGASICSKLVLENEPVQGGLRIMSQEGESQQDDVLLFTRDSNGDFPYTLQMAVPRETIMHLLPQVWNLVLIFSAVAVIFLPLFYILLRILLIRPLDDINHAIVQLQEGNTDYRIKSLHVSREFQTINLAFNSMTEQIKDLKILHYEEQLQKQKARLRILELQVNPHFLLNCLNIIFYLAQSGDFKTISTLVSHMTSFFRYRLRREHELVTLREEIRFVSSYFEIINIRYPECFELSFHLQDKAESVKVPPLIIESLVENSIKHAAVDGQVVHISIETQILGQEVRITVKDDGRGMNAEILEMIQNGQAIVDEEGAHIGLQNTKERIRQLPGGNMSVTSQVNMGAAVELTFLEQEGI